MNQMTMALIPWGAFKLVARYGANARAGVQEQHQEEKEAPAKTGMTIKDEMKQKMKEKMKDTKCCQRRNTKNRKGK